MIFFLLFFFLLTYKGLIVSGNLVRGSQFSSLIKNSWGILISQKYRFLLLNLAGSALLLADPKQCLCFLAALFLLYSYLKLPLRGYFSPEDKGVKVEVVGKADLALCGNDLLIVDDFLYG